MFGLPRRRPPVRVPGVALNALVLPTQNVPFALLQGHNADILRHLPDVVSMQFPAYVTSQIAVDNEIVDSLMRHVQRGYSFKSFAEDLSESHKAEYDRQRALYYEYAVQDRRAPTIWSKYLDNLEQLRPETIPEFPDFEAAYNGVSISAPSLIRIFLRVSAQEYLWLVRRMQLYDGKYWRGDMSFKLTKRLSAVGRRTVGAHYAVMNEYNQVLFWGYMPSKSIDTAKQGLQGLVNRYKLLHYADCEYFWTDSCCPEREKLAEWIPSLRVPERPRNTGELQFDGMITVVDGLNQVENAVAELRSSAEAECSGPTPIVGCDAEWVVHFEKNKPAEPISLLQLSTKSHAFLFRLCKIGMPDTLKEFLEDPTIEKVGFNMGNDIGKLDSGFDVKLEGAVDVLPLARKKLIAARFRLQDVVQEVLHKRLPKDSRLTDWAAPDLTESQRTYAAKDAFATLVLLPELLSKPDLGVPDWVVVGGADDDADDSDESDDDGRADAIAAALFASADATESDDAAEIDAAAAECDAAEIGAAAAECDDAPEISASAARCGSDATEVGSSGGGGATSHRVLLDVFHAMKRITAGMSKKHVMFPFFAHDLMQAFFIEVKADRAVVEQMLMEDRGLTMNEVKKVSSKYFRRCGAIRRLVPDPATLEERLMEVFVKYSVVVDSKKDQPLFKKSKHKVSDTYHQFQEVFTHIREGCLSDPPGLSMYFHIGETTNGLPKLKCIRSSCQVEGLHEHMTRFVHQCDVCLPYVRLWFSF